MKAIKYLFILAGFALIGASCGGGGGDDGEPTPPPPVVDPDDPDNPDEPENPDNPPTPPTPPVYPTFTQPNWSVSDYTVYENSMTAYFSLPDSLSADQSSTDEIAVFCASECRGVAEWVEVSSGKYVWIVYIHGNEESDMLTVQYYSAQTKHIHQSDVTFSFVKDGHRGNIDSPQVLGLKIRTE